MSSRRTRKVVYFLPKSPSGRSHRGVWHPNTDIYETEDSVVVAIEIPGVKIEDLQVTQHADRLLVRGVRRPGLCERPKRFHQIEIVCGEFEKEIFLPEALRGAPVDAALALGILSLTIAKTAGPEGQMERRIEIEAL